MAQRYEKLLSIDPDLIVTPHIPEFTTSVWAQYSVLAKDEHQRSTLQTRLKEAGIPTAIYYPKPLHLQEAFYHLVYKEGDFPISEDCSKRIFSLPMHPYLEEEAQQRIARILLDSFKEKIG